MDTLKGALLLPGVMLWMLVGPLTFFLSVVETWQGSASFPVKVLVSLTLDAFLAGIWPMTWALWGIEALLGEQTPLDLIFP